MGWLGGEEGLMGERGERVTDDLGDINYFRFFIFL